MPHIRRQPCVFSGHRLLRNLKLQKINSLKKLKINYLLIGIVTLLLAAALWPSIPWSGKPENRVAGIIARGELRISTINSPMTFATMNNKAFGLDYELAKQFADYLGVTLKITVRQNISQLFDDLDDGQADMLAAGLVYNQERVKNYQAGPTYYSVSQQLVYRVGNTRPRTLAALTAEQLTIAPGHVAINDLQTLKAEKYPDLAWRVDEKRGTTALMQAVIDGKLDYTIADSVAVSLFQRVHPELAVALDITDEQPVTWFSARDDDNSLSAAMLDFFNNINEDGTLARLEEKYLGHGNDFDYVDTRTFLRAVENILPEVQPLFEKYAREIDWRLLAAIAWQESHWDPQATSPTGVRGMMMLTRNTAQSLGLTDRTDAAQSIDGGMRYLQDMMDKVPDSIPKDERIWFALAAYNMGYAHMLDAMALTRKQKGNPNSWADVKLRLPLLSQKPYYSKLKYGYARGHEAYAYVENIRKYQISLVGYLSEKERQQQQTLALAEDYPAVLPNELEQPQETTLPFFKFRAAKQMDNARMKLPGHLY
ncbi:membrane-bound lytic murein transglycosylase MltF [Klebsiella pneumoniae]|jgi:membrane-bound lytic murein transglycosylase F|uniref:membrane-bound lytic murein transglycosylase MltF n=1 Tax=Klebsiella pneumoniae TaxID=573 RepID=UPI000B957C7D|nr:membrane-bound lytic murein transglycosylase MltF [Klebsiella pneumoniae]MCT4362297.1 membrane-bound lytic murein transglycosylase MltF [Klebsiella pneumoniae]MDA3141628.1 membrane-bound lytic murein transglycosylase MltF [Klebsiella pneumoniae]OYI99369.1 lytic transglycosylase F [Klebsiella pneumoniae subsp. pneumoniae]HBX7754861.1 membrane-bound lytic murein transglycosylase MltF [Klebsiella pneumoniae]HDY8987203.1 membrane-bound lytic murein transglycosylase MltF [Klebsiella pneumoniae]